MTETFLPLVHVIMPTWNQREDTLECLASLARMSYQNQHVLLIDNGSQDGTAASVMAGFPQVELIRNEQNRGFAAAVNQGLRRALAEGGDLFLVLNNDTIADPEMLGPLVSAMRDRGAGMAVPKIYFHSSPDVIWSIGAGINRLTLEQTGGAEGQQDCGQWETVIERDFVTACAALLSRELIEKIGFLDERFFYYYDDIDWSLRVLEAGQRILLVPEARLWHKVAAASRGVDTPYHRYWMGRSSVLYFRKHVRGAQWLVVIPYRLGSALKTTVRLLGQGRMETAWAYWRGLRDGLWKGQPAQRPG